MRPELISTAHGICAVVELREVSDEMMAALPAAERAHAAALTPMRRRDLIAGRAALRALLPAELRGEAVLPDDRGAPVLPAGWVGSISHKSEHAAAIVAPADGTRVGVDLERAQPSRVDIAARILTARELATLPDRGRGATLRFSIKEAIYKAIDPFLRRYVGFQEVELDVVDGVAHVTSALPLAIETTWREHAGFWLATARASRR